MSYCSSEIVNQGCKLSISFKFMVEQQHQSTVSPMGCSQKTNFFFFLGTSPYSVSFKGRKLAQSPKVRVVMSCFCICLLLSADYLVIRARRNTLFNVLDLEEGVIQV